MLPFFFSSPLLLNYPISHFRAFPIFHYAFSRFQSSRTNTFSHHLFHLPSSLFFFYSLLLSLSLSLSLSLTHSHLLALSFSLRTFFSQPFALHFLLYLFFLSFSSPYLALSSIFIAASEL